MRLWIVAVGARPRDAFDELGRMYVDRIAPLLPGSGKSPVETPVYRTEEAMWDAVERERSRAAPQVVLLDERGRSMSSEAFAKWMGHERDEGRQLLVFAVGPADGWSRDSLARAGERLSLGPMTLAHELARVVLCEQVYRALTILAGHPYHRGASGR
ncbi:MAG TPA: 23S rRNA (pseudouridine(1915)-N(3))-methyltransferase RlmH [Acidobacteriaceae bacterium]|nr:23S rRNA (pseudouridine(1915)-N(3))-methyltransferase RlmH [Acidobacteriaceae bacterium]